MKLQTLIIGIIILNGSLGLLYLAGLSAKNEISSLPQDEPSTAISPTSITLNTNEELGIVKNSIVCNQNPSLGSPVVKNWEKDTFVNIKGKLKNEDVEWYAVNVYPDNTCYSLTSAIGIKTNTEQSETETNTEQSQTETNTDSHTSNSGGSGRCDYPDDVDSRGRRCGNRAASVRKGGRLGGYR
jgi:hypothetical protein